MSVSKYEIYEYWSDKSITRDFQVKRSCDCTPLDEAVAIMKFPDEIVCWACGAPPYAQGNHKKLSALWNSDRLLQKAHILAQSKGGADLPPNRFLLCPQCHAESPDTTNPRNFFAWVYYKRTHENYATVFWQDIEKAAEILGVDQETLKAHIMVSKTPEEDAYLRHEILCRCALHGTFLAPLTRAMAMVDWWTDDESQQRYAQWREERRKGLQVSEEE